MWVSSIDYSFLIICCVKVKNNLCCIIIYYSGLKLKWINILFVLKLEKAYLKVEDRCPGGMMIPRDIN